MADAVLRGKVALVTGSSSGIGAATARSLAAQGATVVVNSSTSVAAGEALAAELPGASYVRADIADESEAVALVASTVERHGGLDILVNNAGTTAVIPHADLEAATPDVFRRIFGVNVIGSWQVTVAAVPHLKASGAGTVVNVSSLAGHRPVGSSIPYAASKAALSHMTILLANVLGPEIRVNAVAPGLVDTPWTADWDLVRSFVQAQAPLARTGTPEDIAEVILSLVTARYVTGEIVLVDGGTSSPVMMTAMDFDLWLPTANPFTTPALLTAIAAEAEQRGINAIWVGEHVVTFDDYASSYPYADDGRIPLPGGTGLLEPFATLAFLAALTSTVRLGTAMCLLPQRNPVYTAKEVATLDWLSSGRVDLGVGVGWLREEFEALEVPWERRGARTDDYLGVLKSLWTEDPSSFAGDFYTLAPCSQFPKPVQDPHPPIHIGGESEAALKRTARMAQGWHSFNRRPADLAAPVARLEELLALEGRFRSDITVTICPYFQELSPTTVAQYAAAGADAVAALLFVTDPADVPGAFDALAPSMAEARSV